MVNVRGTRGGTLIVDKNGNGDYTNIQDAIDDAGTGDTIKVWAGTYEETVDITTTLTLTGNGSSSTIIDGQGLDDFGLEISANN